MSRLLCFVFGHRPRVKWYWQSHKGWKPTTKNRVMAQVTCTKCGKEFGGFSCPPK